MKKHNKHFLWIVCLFAVPVVVFISYLVVWLIVLGGSWFSPNPPEPRITSGEFPFELVYTYQGETVTVTDVYVCNYEGISVNEGTGKCLEWKGYIKSSNAEALTIANLEEGKILCYVGSPSYYMSDPQYNEMYAVQEWTPNFSLHTECETLVTSHSLSQEELDDYGIKVIKWESTAPLENSYE